MKLNIAPLLAEKHISQSAFADALGVNKSYVSELVSGKKEPSFETLRKMVDVLGVSIGSLFGDKPISPQVPGFSESQAEEFDLGEAGPLSVQSRLFQAMKLAAKHPMAYRITRNIPSLAMVAHDILVVDLGKPATSGDIILLGLTDRQGFNTVTLVRRLIGDFAVSAEFDDQERAINVSADARAAWRGTVKGLIRDKV